MGRRHPGLLHQAGPVGACHQACTGNQAVQRVPRALPRFHPKFLLPQRLPLKHSSRVMLGIYSMLQQEKSLD